MTLDSTCGSKDTKAPTNRVEISFYVTDEMRRAVAYHFGTPGPGSRAEVVLFIQRIVEQNLDSLVGAYRRSKS
jgi:hypothetical protein